MGAINIARLEFAATISEKVGYKSGLVLNREEMAHHVPDYEDVFLGDEDGWIRIRSEDVEQLFGNLLHAVGAVASPGITFPVIDLSRRYAKDEDMQKLSFKVIELFLSMSDELLEESSRRQAPVDPAPFLERAEADFGMDGLLLGLEFVELLVDHIQRSPWSDYRRIEWQDTLALRDLFESERLEARHGTFFDQRFIDYLNENFDSIDKINWRQFEGLTCEFFDRLNLNVEIGAGRDDGNIDVRVWDPSDPVDGPPAILIQCKRVKEKVGKVVVKALYADMLEENARSGLIVTTSALAPGAEKVCTARAYPIGQADRNTLREWLQQMRTPLVGVFLGL